MHWVSATANTSTWSRSGTTALVEYDIPAACLASYFPETNALVPLGSHAERARTPASKSIPVYLRRAESAAMP